MILPRLPASVNVVLFGPAQTLNSEVEADNVPP